MAHGHPSSLERFVGAQEDTYAGALAELEAGRKRTHWMWYVFPQLAELGRSATAKFYGLAGVEEARAYLGHPVLGERLRVCTRAVLAHRERSAYDIFGSPDDLKFRSSMTLFMLAAPDELLFREALDDFCDGEPDPLTLRAVAG